MDEYLGFAKKIALESGEIILKYFEKLDKNVSQKNDTSLVTQADIEINSILIERIRQAYPSHAVLGEEEVWQPPDMTEQTPRWVCDPLDGTGMFVAKIPLSMFSLALVIDGKSLLGVVFDPFLNKLYWAMKDGGAFRQDLATKEITPLSINNFRLSNKYSAHISTRRSKEFDLSKIIEKLPTRNYDIGTIVRAGISVAEGGFIFAIAATKKACDVAALKIIIEEAGGIVRSLYGTEEAMDSDINGIIISGKDCHEELVKVVKNNLVTSI